MMQPHPQHFFYNKALTQLFVGASRLLHGLQRLGETRPCRTLRGLLVPTVKEMTKGELAGYVFFPSFFSTLLFSSFSALFIPIPTYPLSHLIAVRVCHTCRLKKCVPVFRCIVPQSVAFLSEKPCKTERERIRSSQRVS